MRIYDHQPFALIYMVIFLVFVMLFCLEVDVTGAATGSTPGKKSNRVLTSK